MCCSERRKQRFQSQYSLQEQQGLIQPQAQQRRQRQASYREAQRRSVFDASSNFNVFDLFSQHEEPEVNPIKQSRTFPEYGTHQRRPRTSTYRDAHRQSVFHDSSNFNIYDLFPQRTVVEVSQPHQESYSEQTKRQHSTMAAIIWVGMAIGAEKLGRKISEKRAEKKKQKAAEQRELMYGNAESSRSASHVARNRSWDEETRPERKSEEARRERRRSVSSERSWSDSAPPRYEEVVRGGGRKS